MRKEKRTFGRTLRWTWAVAVTILVHVGLYWGVALTRKDHQNLKRQERQLAQVQYLDSEPAEQSPSLEQQRMTLYDPRPLLLPTQWNVSNAASLLGTWQEEEEIFPEMGARFELEDGNYIDDFGNVPASYDRLSLAQVEFSHPPFRGLGTRSQGKEFAGKQGLDVSVVNPRNGEILSRSRIYNDAIIDLLDNWPGIRPSTLVTTVSDSFHVGGLSVIKSTGYDEADRSLSRIVYSELQRLGPLSDGVYLLEIVP